MDTIECIATKFDVRQFSNDQISDETKKKILDAARFSGSGLNTQHWRFVLVEKKENLIKLAQDSTSGQWVSGASFAVIILTNPQYKFHALDAGRVVQNMQLAAWNLGIASGIFTGVNEDKIRKHFSVPDSLSLTVTLGFGIPAGKHNPRRKNRKPLHELVFSERFGNSMQAYS